MFGFLKKSKSLTLVAPVDGKVLPLDDVPDQVFAQKMAGDGIAIDPTGNVVCAPADGTLSLVFKTGHAFAMTLDNGVEILVHIGIDTVELQGEGFKILKDAGIQVKAGEPIIEFDAEFIKSKGKPLITPVLITNYEDKTSEINGNVGDSVVAGKDTVLSYKIKK